jgi:uncharacterized protein (DUF169 family)
LNIPANLSIIGNSIFQHRLKEAALSPTPGDLAILDKFDFERPPVGVKFLVTRPMGLKRPGKQLDFCEMLAEAQQGNAFYVTRDDFTCIGPLLLGMIAEDPIFESGRVGPKLQLYRDVRANRRLYQYLPRMARNSVKYVAFAPLDKLNFDPDLLIIMANVTQAETLIRAKAYATGETWSARGTPAAGCAWLYIYPLQSGEMNLTVTGFGFGMKSRRLLPEGRILLTIPWDKLPGIIKNLEEMEWIPESYTLGKEGHKKRLKEIVAELEKEE